ncbi:MAG TPA: outer membrane beta-barrel protein, partial [Thermoanaerobaculia bacterium]|nr:outer membrane beta-barrel protein [Thermoanaerobaculia bacterium]
FFKSFLVRGILLVAAVALGCASAPASAQFYFGVSAGMYQPEGQGKSGTDIFDVRGGYRVRPQVGFEWSFSRVTLEETVDPAILPFDFDLFNVSADLTNLDLSVQWFPRNGNFVVFGGPGIAMIDSRINVVFIGMPFTDSDITNIFTAHAGLGYAWQLGNGFFILPEVRARRYFGAEVTEPSAVEGFRFSYQATDFGAGLTVGWRFGS